MGKAEYMEKLAPLQLELNRLARWVQTQGQRVLVLVIEGRDTAGKGGAIAAISDTLNPRQCHVVALPKPSDRERTQWYFQRYVPHLPAAGEIVLFDRSWYNRAGVEPVMGFCSAEQSQAFLKQAPRSRSCWSTTASCCSSTGSRSTRRSRRALRRAPGRPAEALEAQPHRPEGAREVRRLHRRPRDHAQGHATAATRPGRWWTSTTSAAAA
jgi:hypothetical protein